MEHHLSNINVELNGSLATKRYSDTDCLFQLAHPIIAPANTHILVALRTFTMVNAFYNINTGINDTLTITCDSPTGGTQTAIITIPIGSYTINQLRTNLNTQLTSLAGSLNLDSISISIDGTKQGLYFSLSYSTHTLTYIEFSATAYRELGLLFNTATRFTGVTTGYFNKGFNMLGNSQMFVRLKNFQMDNRNMRQISGIIAAIPAIAPLMSRLTYESPQLIYFKVNSHSVQTIDLAILDQDMNGLGDLLVSGEFRITLSFKFSWDKDVIHPKLINENKLSPYIPNEIINNASKNSETDKKADKKISPEHESGGQELQESRTEHSKDNQEITT